MGKASRDKGARGERAVAAIFQAAGFDCARVPNSGGLRLKGDLYGDVPAHLEVKHAEAWRMAEWLEQARTEAGDRWPVLAFRRNATGWYAALPLEVLVAMLAELRAARESSTVAEVAGV